MSNFSDFTYMLFRYRRIYFERSKNLSTWFGLPTRSDRRALPNHTSAELLCGNFGVPDNEKVLFSRDISPCDDSNEGLILTDRRIYYSLDVDDIWAMDLDEIIDVYYNGKGCFVFVSNSKMTVELPTKYFFYCSEGREYYDQLASLLKELIYYPYKELFSGKTTSEKAEFAKELLDYQLDYQLNYPIIHKSIAEDLADSNQYEESRKSYISAYVVATSRDEKSELLESIKAIESKMAETGIWNDVVKKPYSQRKYLMVMSDKNFGQVDMKNSLIYRISNIPTTITFPFGHPTEDTLYVANPSNNALYIPQEQSEEILFLEKVYEYCDMLRCLGATEICITFEKGLTLDAMTSYTNGSKLEADLGFMDGTASEHKSGNTQSKLDEQSSKRVKFVYDPIKKPFLQTGNWYELNSNWQRMAYARLESNLLEYKEVFATKNSKRLDSDEKDIIDAALKVKGIKVNGTFHEDSTNIKKEQSHLETKWVVSVKFKSLKDWE